MIAAQGKIHMEGLDIDSPASQTFDHTSLVPPEDSTPVVLACVTLSFELDETAGILYAMLTHSESPRPFDQNAIESQLRELGYQAFYCEEGAFALLQTRMQEGSEARLAFSRKLDAEVAIEISADRMQAHITTTPAYGGALLDYLKVFAALKAARIDSRFYAGDVIPGLINGAPVVDQLLAEGMAAVNGSDGQLTCLVRETSSKQVQEDCHGHIDPHHELNQFIVVEAGAALMRRQPATPGVDGYDVCGIVLIAKPGKELNFSSTLSGAGIDPQDPNLLVALIKGHPILMPTAVKVDPVLHLQEVSIKTGNIDFDGAVSVDGDVHAGMMVRASSNVHINGIVEKATIIAGNDIVVIGGVVGGDTSKDGKKHAAEEHGADSASELHHHGFKSLLKAGGSIRAKYINQAEVDCGADLVVTEYLMHSTAHVQGQVLLGQTGGKGCLIGGHCHAGKGLAAHVLGNEHCMKTHVSTGFPRNKLARLGELAQEQEKLSGTLARLQEALDKLGAHAANCNPGDELHNKIRRIQQAIAQLSTELETVETEQAMLQAQITAGKLLQITFTQKVFPNVTVSINGEELRVDNENGNGSFQLHSGRVRFTNQAAARAAAPAQKK